MASPPILIPSRFCVPLLLAFAIASAGCTAEGPASSADGFGKVDYPDARDWNPDSREFKLLLDPAPFSFDQEAALLALVDEVAIAATLANLDFIEALVLKKERTISFLDTPGTCDFNANNLVLRERITPSKSRREITLKHRSNDFFPISEFDLQPADGAKQKFEEDIVPPFSIKYSRSATLRIGNEELSAIGDIRKLFYSLDEFSGTHVKLARVGGALVDEEVYLLGLVDFGAFDTELSITVWRFEGESSPKAVELSFSYKRRDESYDFGSESRSLEFFEALGLVSGVLEAGTKTGLVYARDPSFCDD